MEIVSYAMNKCFLLMGSARAVRSAVLIIAIFVQIKVGTKNAISAREDWSFTLSKKMANFSRSAFLPMLRLYNVDKLNTTMNKSAWSVFRIISFKMEAV